MQSLSPDKRLAFSYPAENLDEPFSEGGEQGEVGVTEYYPNRPVLPRSSSNKNHGQV